MLALPAADLHRQWYAGSQLRHAMIEERQPRFQTDRHRRAIDLGEDVVGQIAYRVAVHHPDCVGRCLAKIKVEAVPFSLRAEHRAFFLVPFVEEAEKNIVGAVCRSGNSEAALHPDAEKRAAPAINYPAELQP